MIPTNKEENIIEEIFTYDDYLDLQLCIDTKARLIKKKASEDEFSQTNDSINMLLAKRKRCGISESLQKVIDANLTARKAAKKLKKQLKKYFKYNSCGGS